MEKRTQLVLLLLVGLLLIGIGIYFVTSPIREERRARTPLQLPERVQPFVAPTPQITEGATTTIAPASPEIVGRDLLEYRARATVERIGSGSSRNGFRGYRDALLDATSAGRAALLREQQALQKKYPETGPVFGISTRAVSSKILDGNFGNSTLTLLVEAIQREDSGDPSAPTRIYAKQARITFIKQPDGMYFLDAIEWKEMTL